MENTWICQKCNYKQDFDPTNNEKMAAIFPGVKLGKCAACAMGQTDSKEVFDSDMVLSE